MDSKHLLERIEAGELKLEDEIDGVKVRVELEAADQLGMLLKRIQMDAPPRNNPQQALRRQAHAIVEKITYLDGDLKVIEIDGVSNAVQIRSRKPDPDGFVEVMLQKGNSISLERRPAALHISKSDFRRVIDDLRKVF